MGGVVLIGLGIVFLLALAGRGGKEKTTPTMEQDIEDVLKEEASRQLQEPTSFRATVPPSLSQWAKPEQWDRYILKQKVGKLGTITKGNHLGWFLLGARTLEDLGYLTNVKKDTKGVWRGEWVAPWTLDKWLSDANEQYTAFEKMTANHARAIVQRYRPRMYDPTKPIEGQMVTLSGLLGVAKRAGLGGLDKWINETPETRKRSTTDEFLRTNAVF